MTVDIAIIGFQKAGTTSIQNYIGQHKDVITHPQKEMTFFSDKTEFDKGLNLAVNRYFKGKKKEKKTILIKHATLIRSEVNIQRLKKHNPNCKIIICLRDPVERAYSSYLMELANGANLPAFDDLIKQAFEKNHKDASDWHYNVFIKLGEYHRYVSNLFSHFTKEQVYFIQIEEFHKSTKSCLTSLFKWLKLDIDYVILPKAEKHNTFKVPRKDLFGFLLKSVQQSLMLKSIVKSIIPQNKHYLFGEKIRDMGKRKGTKNRMSNETEQMLRNHYQQHNEALKKIMPLNVAN